jgi:Heterokaryon incompatibility protein (HET)
MAKYHYTQLSRANSIRLMTFEPPRTYPDGSIAIELIEVDLTTHPEYDALSYTWGNMHDTVPIAIQDKTLNITTNLLAFLNRLHHESSAPEVRKYFWADQICINQSDTKERNQQVAIMSDIYRSCQRTLIWLGEEDGDSEIFFGLLNRIQLLGFDRDVMLSMAIINRTCDDLRDYFGNSSGNLSSRWEPVPH